MSISKYWKIIKQAVAVNSSSISDITYDANTKTMVVTFKNGRTYEYENVDSKIHDDFIHAPSIGVYFNKNIRDSYNFKEML